MIYRASNAPPHSFVLVTPLRQYVLAAENDEDRRAWVAALDAACSAGAGGTQQPRTRTRTQIN